jgi:hypothetical protein
MSRILFGQKPAITICDLVRVKNTNTRGEVYEQFASACVVL